MIRGSKFGNGMDKLNGHLDLSQFKSYQEQKFEGLESVLRRGFDQVTEELRMMREQGHIPISVARQITEQQKTFIMPIIKFLCITLLLIVMWFTGLKAALPHIFAQ